MNRPLLTLLAFACLAGVLKAQTNLATVTGKSIEIRSDAAEFDLKTRLAIHRGNVRVAGEGMQLACETLTAKLPVTGGRIESMVAETNVVIDLMDEKGQMVEKGQKIHGTGDKLVYTYATTDTATNEIVQLMGNPILKIIEGPVTNVVTGDVITLDRINNKLKVTNYHGTLGGEANSKTNLVKPPQAEPGKL